MKNNQLPISNYIGNVFSLVMLEAATVMQYRTQLDRKIESLIPRNAIYRTSYSGCAYQTEIFQVSRKFSFAFNFISVVLRNIYTDNFTILFNCLRFPVGSNNF